MRKVSYKTILRDLYEDTDLQKMKINEIYLARLIRKADKRIQGLYTINLSKKVFTLENSIIPFPDDLFNVDYVLLGDFSNNNTYFLNTNNDFIISVDESIQTYYTSDENGEITDIDNITNYRLWSDISFVIESNKIDFVIANGQINIDPQYNGEKVTLVYSSYPKNEKGEIMINENHIDPIIAWIKHHVFERDMFKRKMSAQRLYSDDFSFVRLLESNKNKLYRNARVEDRNLNAEYLNKNTVVNSYNLLIENDSY